MPFSNEGLEHPQIFISAGVLTPAFPKDRATVALTLYLQFQASRGGLRAYPPGLKQENKCVTPAQKTI